MKYELLFCVYATMVIEVDDPAELQEWDENLGDFDHQFELETIDNVYALSFKEIEDAEGN